MKKVRTGARIMDVAGYVGNLIRRYSVEDGIHDDEMLSDCMKKATDIHDAFVSAINKKKVSFALTEEDNARDDILRRIGRLLDGLAAHPDEALASSAKKVQGVYNQHCKGMSVKVHSHLSESGLISALLKDLAEDEIERESAKLDGIPVLIEMLSDAQQKFNSAYDQRNISRESVRAEMSASDLKGQLIELINTEFLPCLELLHKREPEKFEKFYNFVAAETDAVYNAQGGKQSAKKVDASFSAVAAKEV